MIPWKAFALLFDCIETGDAAEHLRIADGTTLAIATAFGEKNGAHQTEHRRLWRLAYPKSAEA